MHPVVRAILQSNQFKGKASFDGSGDFLTLGGQSDFAYGTSDFCVELFYMSQNTGAAHTLYDTHPVGQNGYYTRLVKGADNKLFFNTNNTTRITGATALQASTRYHIALTKTGGATKIYLNGVQEGSSYADTNRYLCGANRPILGAEGYSTDSYNLYGYLYGIRITNGDGRYAGSFAPPTEFTVDSANVKLCMNFAEPLGSTTFIDETGKTVTTNGNVVIVE